MKIISIFLLLLFVSCSSTNRTPSSVKHSILTNQNFEMVTYPSGGKEKIRIASFKEKGSFKGCVLYLEGLGDSLKNHMPFFSKLTDHGYRVIAFDYKGQGGSEGSMNDVRINVELPPNATKDMIKRYERVDKFKSIPVMADFVWTRSPDCHLFKKRIIGWSTGGAAAYVMAHKKQGDVFVLIAPAIAPKVMIGESAKRWDKMLSFRQTITERTLTRNTFENEVNPHQDDIKPKSPMHVPQFAGNLMLIASLTKNWKIDSSIKGMAFLSGKEDTYVDRDKTLSLLQKNAPHFKLKIYNGALHELDNELPEVSQDLHESVVRFLDQN